MVDTKVSGANATRRRYADGLQEGRSLVKDGDSWRIEGDGAGSAVLAFAKDVNGKLVYEVEDVPADEWCARQQATIE